MNRRKLRRVAKWVGPALVVGLVCVDIMSEHWMCRADPYRGLGLGLNTGEFWAYWTPTPRDWPRAWILPQSANGRVVTYRDFSMTLHPLLALGVPIWFCTLVVTLPTAYLWWRDRRDKSRGHCAKCGYDLTGLAPGSKCPECGRPSIITGPAQEKS